MPLPNLLLHMKSYFSSVLLPPDPLCQYDIFSPKGTCEMKLLGGVKHVISTCLNAQFQMPASASGTLRSERSGHLRFLSRSSGLCFSEDHNAEIIFKNDSEYVGKRQ